MFRGGKKGGKMKKIKGAEMGFSTFDTNATQREITLFTKEFGEALNKFKDVLDIPDNVWEKVDKLYSRLYRIEAFLDKAKEIELRLMDLRKLFGFIEKGKEWRQFLKLLNQFFDILEKIEQDWDEDENV